MWPLVLLVARLKRTILGGAIHMWYTWVLASWSVYGTVSNGDSSKCFLTPLSAMEITPHMLTRWRNILSPSGMALQPKMSARMMYSSLPYDGSLANLTLSRKQVPTPHGWLDQGWFFSGDQQVTPAATHG